MSNPFGPIQLGENHRRFTADVIAAWEPTGLRRLNPGEGLVVKVLNGQVWVAQRNGYAMARVPDDVVEHMLAVGPHFLEDVWVAKNIGTWEGTGPITVEVRSFHHKACGCVVNFGGYHVHRCPAHPGVIPPRGEYEDGLFDPWTGDPRPEQESIYRSQV